MDFVPDIENPHICLVLSSMPIPRWNTKCKCCPCKEKLLQILAVIPTVTLQSTPADNSNKMVCNANIKNYITYVGALLIGVIKQLIHIHISSLFLRLGLHQELF